MGDSPETPFDLFQDYLRFASCSRTESFQVMFALFGSGGEVSAFVLWRHSGFHCKKSVWGIFFIVVRSNWVSLTLCLTVCRQQRKESLEGSKVRWRRCFLTGVWSLETGLSSNCSCFGYRNAMFQWAWCKLK